MSWYNKEQPTPFDSLPIPGLFFLDGDQFTQVLGKNWTADAKYAMVVFPSGVETDIWKSQNPDDGVTVYFFGEVILPFKGTRDQAFEQLNHIPEESGYWARKVGEDGLEICGPYGDEHFLITYDKESRAMLDVVEVHGVLEDPPEHPGQVLMSEEVSASLPKLYRGEKLGTKAIVQVKYFMPGGSWTWYASEFDGEEIFFGLVVDTEIRLRPFSLSQLRELHSPDGHRIERDLHFVPKTLDELIEQHRKEREDHG